mgnify:CR=1 FL=1
MSSEQPDTLKTKPDESAPTDSNASNATSEKAEDQNKAATSKDAGEEKKSSKNKHSNVAPYNKHIEVLINSPLPHLDRGPVKAYKAKGQNNVPSNLVAFICERHLVPRWQAAPHYKSIMNANIARLVTSGLMPWPVDNGQRYAFIYENNWSQPAFQVTNKAAFGMKAELLLDEFIKPVIAVLHDFQEKGFVHGGIRLDNFFFGKTNQLRDIVLGESLCTPCSYMQPVLYEPIDRAMAAPIGRGLGTFADDLYSFGVVLTVLLRKTDPLEGMSDEQVIQEKIEKGSYGALTGKDRFTGEILELLRGILHDDRSARWTIDDVLNWLDGTRLSPKQSIKRKKASRALNVGSKRFVGPELAAFYSQDHGSQMLQLIEDNKLEQWVERSLEDKDTGERLELAMRTSKEFGEGELYQNGLLSRVSIALDPSAPIRYRGLKFRPDGFGTALAEAFVLEKDLNPFKEVIQQNIIMFWLNSQTDNFIDFGSIATRFESCRTFLKNTHNGFGLERCLYFLSSEVPCLSSLINNYFVMNAEEYALAVNDALGKNARDKLILDRHSIAFLASRDSKTLDSYLIELNSQDKMSQILGNLNTFHMIQDRYKLPPLPHITSHIVKLMGPIVDRFHDMKLQENMNGFFDKVKNTGDITRLKSVLHEVNIVEQDLQAFLGAMQNYAMLTRDKKMLQKKLDKKEKLGQSTGRNFAAILSACVGGAIILGVVFYKFSHASIF